MMGLMKYLMNLIIQIIELLQRQKELKIQMVWVPKMELLLI